MKNDISQVRETKFSYTKYLQINDLQRLLIQYKHVAIAITRVPLHPKCSRNCFSAKIIGEPIKKKRCSRIKQVELLNFNFRVAVNHPVKIDGSNGIYSNSIHTVMSSWSARGNFNSPMIRRNTISRQFPCSVKFRRGIAIWWILSNLEYFDAA